jgi:hypothetical protein
MDQRTQRVRELNDRFRKHLLTVTFVMSPGVSDLGEEAGTRIVAAIAAFDDFSRTDDPDGQHNLGAFEADGQTIIFKIDCFDTDLKYQSPDPTDPVVTVRVMTVMLAHEYPMLETPPAPAVS